jgi:hypothetical protein
MNLVRNEQYRTKSALGTPTTREPGKYTEAEKVEIIIDRIHEKNLGTELQGTPNEYFSATNVIRDVSKEDKELVIPRGKKSRLQAIILIANWYGVDVSDITQTTS